LRPEEVLVDELVRPAILDGVIAELDVVELRLPVGSWNVGTRGTVHEVRPDALLVEIADEDGVTRDLITVPVDAARVVWSMDEHRGSEPSENVPARPEASQKVPDSTAAKSPAQRHLFGSSARRQ
jgi:hypothetical protein